MHPTSPETTLLVLFGASQWPKMKQYVQLDACLTTANDIKTYFCSPTGFALPPGHFLDLFDSPREASILDELISSFLKQRIKGRAITDLIIYYIGHGCMTARQDYYFIVRATRSDNIIASGFSPAALGQTLKFYRAYVRIFLILDACFSSSAVTAFMSMAAERDIIERKLLSYFPKRGTALLCSSSAYEGSKVPQHSRHTMFSGELLNVLHEGIPDIRSDLLSLVDIESEVTARIIGKYGDDAVRPSLIAADQSAGNVSQMPLFPNLAIHQLLATTPTISMRSPMATALTESVELQLRTFYSANRKRFDNLQLWLTNTLSELACHDPFIYSYQTRIKTIESLLTKVRSLISKPESTNLTSISDFFSLVHDVVGARVIVYVPGKMIKLHESLTSNFRRFSVTRITLHYHKDNQFSLFDSMIKRISSHSDVELLLQQNETGYFGLHYLFHPCPCDEFYKDIEQPMYGEFELQIRTLLQHAWSELQHKVVYKSAERPDYNKDIAGVQFENLSHMLMQCDVILDRLCEPITPAPSHEIDVSVLNSRFKNTIKDIQRAINVMELQEIGDLEKKERCLSLIEKYKYDIEKIKSSKRDYVIESLQVAELYLKAGYYNEAYDIYHDILQNKSDELGQKDAWTLLRFAETCSYLAKDDEAINSIVMIAEKYRRGNGRKKQEDDNNLFTGASLLSWQLNRLDEAIKFGEMAIEASGGEDEYKEFRSRLNLMYYVTDSYAQKYAGEPIALRNALEERKKNAAWVAEREERHPEWFSAGKYDTLVYYYYNLANAAYLSGDKGSAKEYLAEGIRYTEKYKKARELLSDKGKSGRTDALGKQHYVLIRTLEAELDL